MVRMSPTRFLARPMLAAYFIADGVDAVRSPGSHVEKFRRVTPLLEKAGVPPVLSADATLLARASGLVSAVAGLCLATGRRPRTAALTLAALNVPLTLVNNPVLQARGADRKEALRGLLRGLGIGGGLLLAAVDREGRPSLGWRYSTWLDHRQDLKSQKAALKARYASA